MSTRYILNLFVVFGSINLFAQPACVNDNCCCGNIVQVPFPGGNFEDPPTPPPGGIITFFTGDTYSTWSIDGGSIDLLDAAYNGWGAGNPNGASNFIDLNGSAPGTISTNLNGLTIGCTYTVVLWYAKNAGVSSANCTIKVEGGSWLNQTWTATNNGAVEWLEKCFSFVAQATSTDLQLIGSGGAANRGVLLDDITIWQCCSDTEAPVIEAPPSPLQSECGDPLPPVPTLNVSDNCTLPVLTEFTEDNNPSPCFYTITREWLATDGCGNTTTISQTIEVEDTQAPVFDPPPSDYTTICSDGFLGEFYDWIAANGYGDASDLCGSPVSWEINYAFPPDGSCSSIPVQFIVSDVCGNTREMTAYFTIEDYDAPQIIKPAQNLTVNCDPNAGALFSDWLADNGGAEAIDPCGEITWDNNYSGGLPSGLTFVTFTATDGCSNAVSTTAYFFQPATITTVFIDSTTCNPNLAGKDTVQTNQGNCLTITITNLALVPNDTLLLFDNTCDPNLAGVFTQNLINQGGCDSVVVTTLKLVLVDSTLLFSHTCDIMQAGIFTQNLFGQSGCDSVVISTVSWVASDTILLFKSTCDIAQAGVFNQNLLNQFGCDSIVITTVNWLNSDTTLVAAAPTCDSAAAGVFVQNLVNSNGCDSMVITTVSLIPGFNTQVSTTTCDPALAGVFVQNLSTQNGCDSIVTTTVSLIPGFSTQISSTTCDQALVGVFVQTLTAQNGCDSVVTTIVSLIQGFNTPVFATSCDPALVGVFVQNLTAQNGCDSTVTTTVSLIQGSNTQVSTTTCDPALVGVFVQNLIGQNGCDSTVTTTVSLIQGSSTQVSATTCDPALAGVFVQNLTAQNGCDSILTITVSLIPSSSTQVSATTCDPALAGVFVQNLTAQNGCDSILTITVSLIPSSSIQVSAITCDPALAGVFVQNLTGQNGCDSTVTTTVSLLPGSSTQVSATTCDPALAGVFVQNLVGQNGCDSIVTTTVSLIPSISTQVSATTCDPALAGVFVQNLTGQNGCDSTVTTTVTLQPLETTQLIASGVCDPALAGTSVEIISNQFGCDSVIQTITPLLPSPQLSLSVSQFNGFEISCSNSADGAITANPIGNSPFSFAWSNGGNSSALANLSAGLYTVTATSAEGCISTSQAQLAAPAPLSMDIEVTQPDCMEGSFGALTANTVGGVAPYKYSLNGINFQSTNSFTNLMEGDFQLAVKDNNGCTVSESGNISAPMDVLVSLGDDLTILLGDSLFLQAIVNVPYDSIDAVIWSPIPAFGACINCLTQALQPFATNKYHIEVKTKNGCRGNDDLIVRVNRSKGIYVPNIFSPNNDGINDLVTVFARPSVVRKVQYFQIYSRWGERVYQAIDFVPNQNSLEGWDGLFKGQELNPGVFVWVAEVEFVDGTIEIFSGDVTLLR